MIRYRILPEYRLVVLCFWGTTDTHEVLAMSAELTNDPEFSYDYDTFVDNTHLDHTVSGQGLRELVEREIRQPGPDSKMAVVSPADVTYGVSRMHQLLAEFRAPFQIEVFRDRESALEWLGRGDFGLESVCEDLARDS